MAEDKLASMRRSPNLLSSNIHWHHDTTVACMPTGVTVIRDTFMLPNRSYLDGLDVEGIDT